MCFREFSEMLKISQTLVGLQIKSNQFLFINQHELQKSSTKLLENILAKWPTHRGGSYRGGQGGHAPTPCENCAPLCPPNETGCKVAGLHNRCIHSVTSHSWCQITPFTQSCIMSSKILGSPNEDVATPLATPNCCS